MYRFTDHDGDYFDVIVHLGSVYLEINGDSFVIIRDKSDLGKLISSLEDVYHEWEE